MTYTQMNQEIRRQLADSGVENAAFEAAELISDGSSGSFTTATAGGEQTGVRLSAAIFARNMGFLLRLVSGGRGCIDPSQRHRSFV